MPVILATQEAEIWRMAVRDQPRQTVGKTLSQKNPLPKKKKNGGVAQGAGPEFKPQFEKKKEMRSNFGLQPISPVCPFILRKTYQDFWRVHKIL
jgi:hypothetical protein